MIEVAKTDLMEEPELGTLANIGAVWVFKTYKSNSISQLPIDETFKYGWHLYQIKWVQIVPSTSENYYELYCTRVGVFPP
jgi:hypothetical protein